MRVPIRVMPIGVVLAVSLFGLAATTSSGAGASPRTTSPDISHLAAIAAIPSSKDAIAVGSAYSSSTGQEYNLVERWNGTAWKVGTAPANSGDSSELTGVWAGSTSNIWAVGSSYTTSPAAELSHWNGTSWSAAKVSGMPAGAGLSAIGGTASDLWAVGSWSPSTSSSDPLELHYNGTSWSVFKAGPAGATLSSVSVVSASDAWAVGSWYTTSKIKSAVLHYTGSKWETASVTIPTGEAVLSVAATSSHVWINLTSTTGEGGAALLESSGTWTTVHLPKKTYLPTPSAAVFSKGTVVVAGDIQTGSDTTYYASWLGEYSNGKWAVKTLPVAGNGSSITAVVAPSSNDIWAVGQYWTGKVCASYTTPIAYRFTTKWVLMKMPVPTGTPSIATEPSRLAVPNC